MRTKQPNKEQTVTIGINVPVSVRAALERLAQKEQRTLSKAACIELLASPRVKAELKAAA